MDIVRPYMVSNNNSISFRRPPWLEITKIWNDAADGADIFYKTPHYLDAYYRHWQQVRIEENTAPRYSKERKDRNN